MMEFLAMSRLLEMFPDGLSLFTGCSLMLLRCGSQTKGHTILPSPSLRNHRQQDSMPWPGLCHESCRNARTDLPPISVASDRLRHTFSARTKVATDNELTKCFPQKNRRRLGGPAPKQTAASGKNLMRPLVLYSHATRDIDHKVEM